MDTLMQILTVLVLLMVISLVIAVAGLMAMVRSIRNIRVPRDADFFTTMRFVPLTLVILLDLLDFALDLFSAPITWIVLDRMGLPNLRNKATIEAIIPATGPIPRLRLPGCWHASLIWVYHQEPGRHRLVIHVMLRKMKIIHTRLRNSGDDHRRGLLIWTNPSAGIILGGKYGNHGC